MAASKDRTSMTSKEDATPEELLEAGTSSTTIARPSDGVRGEVAGGDVLRGENYRGDATSPRNGEETATAAAEGV